VQAQDVELSRYVGTEGTAATDLRPSGKAIIGGSRLDVVTRGDYIERDETIVVSAVEGNQIIVMKKP
jgi:membrane-bound serine protease (ClpP class)